MVGNGQAVCRMEIRTFSPVSKNGTGNDPVKYRPVSLSCVKVIEQVLTSRLRNCLRDNQLIWFQLISRMS